MSAPATTSTLLGVSDLRVEFATDHGWSTVVAGTTFSVGEHEIVGLVGESGSGKTVTGLSVLGLLPRGVGRVASGSVTLGGRDLLGLSERELRSVRGNEVAMVFQEPMTSLNPAFRIGDQIAETVRLHRGGSQRAARDRAVEVLDLVGIPHARRRADDYPHEFSGGMRQRAMIAMAVSCEPSLLIADEPTTALDVTIQAQVLELLASMQAELGMSVLLVTHDLGVVAEVCERVVVMYAGQVVEQAQVGELFDHPRHPYTEGLLAAMPQLGSRGHRLPSIPGRTPEPWAMPPGCRFAPRCEYALPACEEPPSLLTTRPDHLSRCLRHDELTLRGAR
ncbi:ABC transporter ATP-binding protein [Pseudonocardia alni]|uniref:Oligopeptide/dipeptide ABC transporter ATP-binding protein n=1 Tax=Pseudonocardia alni TaxID=33907 RepID=A0A852W7J9_PSEA5|nr:ABC transporter ATP-binding protein [Pseudonocardia antarctica]NYG04889.1 oligopeptide/dipeptide ABC transporter ATP-binding protein [Pseudonocardia antarctica]